MSDGYAREELPRSHLRRRWLAAGIAVVGLALGGSLLLGHLWTDDVVRDWLLVVTIVLGYVLALLWVFLPRNRPDGDALSEHIGSGTWVTIGRGVLVAFCAGFLLTPFPDGPLGWLPALLLAAAAAGDAVDGALARRADHETALGARLDVEIDALCVLVGCLLAIRHDLLPAWYLVVGLARYAFVAGIRYRRWHGRPVHALTPRLRGRVLGAIQLGFLPIVLLPPVTRPATTVAAVVLIGPFLYSFYLDWQRVRRGDDAG